MISISLLPESEQITSGRFSKGQSAQGNGSFPPYHLDLISDDKADSSGEKAFQFTLETDGMGVFIISVRKSSRVRAIRSGSPDPGAGALSLNEELIRLCQQVREPAYQEYKQKDIARNGDGYNRIAHELMTMFSELGELKHLASDSDEVQKKIYALQQFITGNYYECTNEILGELGEMDVCDERFRNNIDKAGGIGTADFVRRAIEVYCGKNKV